MAAISRLERRFSSRWPDERHNDRPDGRLGSATSSLTRLLDFRHRPSPEMGIAGAALATGTGQLVPVLFYLIVLQRAAHPGQFRRAPASGPTPAGPAVVRHAACYPEFGAAFGAYLLPEWTAGGILPQSYVVVLGIYYKLRDFPVSARQRHCAGPTSHHWLNYGAGEYDRVKEALPHGR